MSAYRTPGAVAPPARPPRRLGAGDRVYFEDPKLTGTVQWVGPELAGVYFDAGGYVQTGRERFTVLRRAKRKRKKPEKRPGRNGREVLLMVAALAALAGSMLWQVLR